MARQKRVGESVCTCSAYRFPHRFGGGECTGKSIAVKEWESNYGFGGHCVHCNCLNSLGSTLECDVINGGESVEHCEAYQEFVHFHEIKIYKTV